MTGTAGKETLEALEEQLVELDSIKVFDDRVRVGVEHILAAMPPPDSEKDTDCKVRLLLLRCKAKLLMPFVSKDAEKDLHMALKLKQDSAETWVVLAECFLRRNAFKEACDALDNALRAEPENTAALCKYSQVQRNRCGEPGLTAEQKSEFLKSAVDKGRAAVKSNVADADAWNTLSLSLLSVATADGMTYDGARKALAAMQQAQCMATADPDVHFNKAILESLTGEFGAAAADFMRAHELDKTRLKGTRRFCEDNAAVLQRAVNRMRNAAGIGRRDFQKTRSNLSSAVAKAKAASNQAASLTHLAVVDIVTEPKMQPQALLAVDEAGAFSLVLLYGVSGGSFKIGDVVSFLPASTKRIEVQHVMPAILELSIEAITLPLTHYYTDANALLVNGRQLPSQSRVPLQLSSRLFA